MILEIICTIIDITKKEGFGLLSDYDTADRSTSRGHGTMNSDRPKYRSGAATTKHEDSFRSVIPKSSNQGTTPELESIQEFLAISLPSERSRKGTRGSQRSEVAKRSAFAS